MLQAWNLCNLGGLALARGDAEAANDLYNEAVIASVDHPEIHVEALVGQARALLKLNDPEMAESLFLDAAHAAEAAGDLRRAGWVWYDLGESARGRGKHDRAKDALEAALGVATRTGDRLMEGWTLCKLAGCLRDTGAKSEAIARYEQARDVADSLHDEKMRQYAVTRLNALT